MKLARLAEENGNATELASYKQELERFAASSSGGDVVDSKQRGRNKKHREHGEKRKDVRIKEQKVCLKLTCQLHMKKFRIL